MLQSAATIAISENVCRRSLSDAEAHTQRGQLCRGVLLEWLEDGEASSIYFKLTSAWFSMREIDRDSENHHHSTLTKIQPHLKREARFFPSSVPLL